VEVRGFPGEDGVYGLTIGAPKGMGLVLKFCHGGVFKYSMELLEAWR
jgi:hypothetical protein